MPSKHISQHLPGVVIDGVPEPAWMCFRLHNTPHFVELRRAYDIKRNQCPIAVYRTQWVFSRPENCYDDLALRKHASHSRLD
jgi:hypothetical protein